MYDSQFVESLTWACVVFSFLLVPLPVAYAQEVITVNQTTPCFLSLNGSNYHELLDQCGADEDWLDWSLLGWEWITGGNLTALVIGSLILAVYLKWGKALYAIAIGIATMPFAFYLFPESFVSFAIIIAFAAIGMLIAYIYVRQTK